MQIDLNECVLREFFMQRKFISYYCSDTGLARLN